MPKAEFPLPRRWVFLIGCALGIGLNGIHGERVDMQGTLDTPPIIIRTSRTANLIGFIICAAMAYFRIYIFWLGLIYFGWQLIDPNTLKLAPDGFSWRTSFGRRHWAWKEVTNFRPMPWGQLGWDVEGKSHSSFGFGWEMSARKLTDMLNSARSHWLNQLSN